MAMPRISPLRPFLLLSVCLFLPAQEARPIYERYPDAKRLCKSVLGWCRTAEEERRAGNTLPDFVTRAEVVPELGLRGPEDLERLEPGLSHRPAWAGSVPTLDPKDLPGFKAFVQALVQAMPEATQDPALVKLAARPEELLAKGKGEVVQAAFERFNRAQTRLIARNARTLAWLLSDSLDVEELSRMKDVLRIAKSIDYLDAVARYARLTTPSLGPGLALTWSDLWNEKAPKGSLRTYVLLDEQALARTDLPEVLRGIATAAQKRLTERCEDQLNLSQAAALHQQAAALDQQTAALDQQAAKIEARTERWVQLNGILDGFAPLVERYAKGETALQAELEDRAARFSAWVVAFRKLPEVQQKEFGELVTRSITNGNTLIAMYQAIRAQRQSGAQ